MRQEQTKVYSRRKTKKAPKVGGGDDRIGALPDEVLQHVLSFLPAGEAVQTCVLARRWLHLWKSMSSLRITWTAPRISPGYGWWQDLSNLNRLINNLLLLRDRNTQLELCEFHIGRLKYYTDEIQMSSWIQKALLYKVQILSVKFEGNGEMLGNLPLVSQHLKTIKLTHVTLQGSFLNFSSCPALKNLWMGECYIDAEKISSQSLELLTMIKCSFEKDIRTRISAPNLVRLELTDNFGFTPLLDSMPSLVKAFVRLHSTKDYCGKEEFGGSCSNSDCGSCVANAYGTGDCVLLKGLSKAKSLELVADPGRFIFQSDLVWCPTFSNLKTLLLNEWCVEIDFHALVYFLQHMPVLEKLILQLRQALDNWVEAEGSCNPSGKPFASKKLKVVEVKCEVFDKRVHKISWILSTYGKYLEQIKLQRTARYSECYSFETNEDIYR